MKKITHSLLIGLTLLMSACGEPTIDVSEQFNAQPTVQITWADQKGAILPAGFCTEALCMDYGVPDTSNVVFQSYTNGTPVSITLETDKIIQSTTFNLKTTALKTIHNNLDFTEENKAYTLTPNFKESGDYLLSMKWNFEEGGYYSALVPLNIEKVNISVNKKDLHQNSRDLLLRKRTIVSWSLF